MTGSFLILCGIDGDGKLSHECWCHGIGFTGCGQTRPKRGFRVVLAFRPAFKPFISYSESASADDTRAARYDFFRSLFSDPNHE
jgi:hypothetical protein